MFFFIVKIDLANIFEISFASLINRFISIFSTPKVSRIKQSQYFVSFADLRAIEKKLSKFFFELPDFASITFAPIEVALLNNWSIIE